MISKKVFFALTVSLSLTLNIINAFPFDENDYKTIPHTMRKNEYGTDIAVSKMFEMVISSVNGAKTVSCYDRLTKSYIFITIDDYDFFTGKGDIKAFVIEESGQKHISNSYLGSCENNEASVCFYFPNSNTIFRLLRVGNRWGGEWGYYLYESKDWYK